jgi:dTDP-4-dehydrorhamnose 3,5-epimerase
VEIINTTIKGVLLIKPDVYIDKRGFFQVQYNEEIFENKKINFRCKQINHTLSIAKNTIRGLHFQLPPKAQSKIITCIKGSILDVVVDLRPQSETYLKVFSVEISAENKLKLFIPKGLAHGFITREDNVEVIYFVDEFYDPQLEKIIKYDDPSFNIDWGNESSPILSEKDSNAPYFEDIKFIYF